MWIFAFYSTMNYKNGNIGEKLLWIIISFKEINSCPFNSINKFQEFTFKFDPRRFRKSPRSKLRSTVASSYERSSKGNPAATIKIYTVCSPTGVPSFLRGRSTLILEEVWPGGTAERWNNGRSVHGWEGVEEEGSISVLSRCRWNKWIRSVTVVNPRYRWHDPHTLARTRAIRTLSLSLSLGYDLMPSLALYPLPRIVGRNRGPCFSLHLSHLRFIYQLMHDTIVVDPEE